MVDMIEGFDALAQCGGAMSNGTEEELSDIENTIMSEEMSTSEEASEEMMQGGEMKNRSFLTFNASVSNKKVITDLQDQPFQIMASTRNYLTNQTIASYPKSRNENLLLHMNYITRVFNNNAIETNSKERFSLQQYAKLAERVGTKDILIHMPCNAIEVKNIAQGLSIINDELLSRGMIVHLEIAAWSQELITARKIRSRKDVVQYISEFIDEVISHVGKYKAGQFMLVFDTAHLYALGAESKDQIQLFEKYRKWMKYCHLNGNVNSKLTSDSHAPIMSDKSKLKDWQALSAYIAKSGLICIAEITKFGKSWEEWVEYAKQYGFELVKYHDQLSI